MLTCRFTPSSLTKAVPSQRDGKAIKTDILKGLRHSPKSSTLALHPLALHPSSQHEPSSFWGSACHRSSEICYQLSREDQSPQKNKEGDAKAAARSALQSLHIPLIHFCLADGASAKDDLPLRPLPSVASSSSTPSHAFPPHIHTVRIPRSCHVSAAPPPRLAAEYQDWA